MPTELDQRARVIADARTWLRTPYHSCGDVRGAGVDCAMLLVRAFVDCGLLAPFDPRPYPDDWHLHRSDEKYLSYVTDRFVEIETPSAGDIAVFRYGRCFSHGALITDDEPLTIIHAFHPAGCVVEEPLASNLQLTAPGRPRRFFTLWPKGAA